MKYYLNTILQKMAIRSRIHFILQNTLRTVIVVQNRRTDRESLAGAKCIITRDNLIVYRVFIKVLVYH